MHNFNFLVIGSGPAGQKAAIQAAKLGKKVAIVDRRTDIGGVCLHTGTVPSKTMREAVLYLSGYSQRGFYGQGYRLKDDLTMADLKQRLNTTIQREEEVILHQLNRNGIQLFNGTATFTDEKHVQVKDDKGKVIEIQADSFLIATGTYPVHPESYPFDCGKVIDSDNILDLEELPRSMTVIGAGVIGVEYASIFSALDVEVNLIDGRDSLLGFMDKELTDELIHQFRDQGMIVRLGEQVETITYQEDCSVLTVLKSGKQLHSDVVLVAAGRSGNTQSLNLEAAGVELNSRHLIQVNENYQSSQPHIYAAGDIIGFPSLASTAMEQGRQVACHAFGQNINNKLENFPFGIFAVPEMSMVGLTEQELTKKNIPYEVGIARLRETARGQIMGLEHGILKLIFSLEKHELLGVHIIGEGATELIHIGQAALVLNGGLDYFLENVFNYPTLAEAYKIAALDAWNRLN
ncbi:MAG: Si-specific NAD(P)(+) transhydrogenase [gamma proteobacterium symbiont of Taylorina sp.]|nr:Si-specific NAD(P)(+) transhydrogenase [gamma proteobacterium symbiont of Taylorina sp.]